MDNPHIDHRARMRERFFKEDSALQDHEILELLLYYSIPRGDTNPIAHRLIDTFGSLPGVLDASPEALMKVEGIGERSAALLKLIAPICKIYMERKSGDRRKLLTLGDAGNYMLTKFIGERNEVIYAAALDNQYRLLGCRCIGKGAVNAAAINTRKIMEFAMQVNAAGIIMAHNHPGGTALPSRADLATTDHVKAALELVGIKLLDHIIVAGNDYISLKESNRLNF